MSKLMSIIREKAIGVIAKERNVEEKSLYSKQLTTLAKFLKLRYPDNSKPHNKYEWTEAIKSWYQTNNRIVIKPITAENRDRGTTRKDKDDAILLRTAASQASKFVRKQRFHVHKYANDEKFLHSKEWKQIRFMALQRYGAKCMCCGATPQSGAIMNVDHIKPRKIFPELALDINNLQILCHDCNHGKGNWDMTDWRQKETT